VATSPGNEQSSRALEEYLDAVGAVDTIIRQVWKALIMFSKKFRSQVAIINKWWVSFFLFSRLLSLVSYFLLLASSFSFSLLLIIWLSPLLLEIIIYTP